MTLFKKKKKRVWCQKGTGVNCIHGARPLSNKAISLREAEHTHGGFVGFIGAYGVSSQVVQPPEWRAALAAERERIERCGGTVSMDRVGQGLASVGWFAWVGFCEEGEALLLAYSGSLCFHLASIF